MAKILLPAAAASLRGHPWNVWTEDGRWGELLGKIEKIHPKWQTLGPDGRDIAPVCFRQIPRTSVDCLDGRWKMGAVELLGKERKIPINGRNQGWASGIFPP